MDILIVGAGVAGIIVSNHGGRQLATAPATIDVLPVVADAVAGRAEVLVDGGVSNGLDVVRMLALGAKGVLLGRAWLFALATAGEAGVAKLLDLMAREMHVAMTLTGVNKIDAIDRSILAEDVK